MIKYQILTFRNEFKFIVSDSIICMLSQKARDYFLARGGPRLNCAQSVVAADDPKDTRRLAVFANYGGGNAPGGWCGPAYATSLLLGNLELVEREYVKSAGSVKCEEIIKLKKLDCVGCVELGAKIIEQNRKPK